MTFTNTTTRVITYTYDPLNRLTGATYSTGESFEYQYDAVGNRTSMTDTTGAHTYTYDAANRLTSVDDVTYTWDDRGNLVSDGTFTYTYNSAGRMVRAESVTATLVYTYNAQGLRVAQSVDGDVMSFAWDTEAGLSVVISDTAALYVHTPNGQTLAEQRGGVWTYPLVDSLRNVRQWSSADGQILGSVGYRPFGTPEWAAGTIESTYGYTGEYHEPETGLVYLRARHYAPALGRFLQHDPWEGDHQRPQTLNLYAYVENNAVNFTDRTGLCTLCTQGSSVMVYDSWSPDQGVDYRESPSLDARILGQLPNLSRVVIEENAPVLGSGLDWHSTYRYIAPGSRYRVRMWLPNKYLLDDPEPGSYPDVPNPFGLRFRTPPVAIGSVTYAQGFGATQFACNECGGGDGQGECVNQPSCPYRSVRGLHNGLDLSVPDGTIVYWTGSANAPVVSMFAGDASPNVVIQVGTYYVLFGHLSEIYVEPDRHFIYRGTPIGRTGSGHLHLGIRTTSRFYNPLYFFERDLADTFTGLMGAYIEGEGPWSMQAYTYSSGRCQRYFWGCSPDRTGIDRP